MQLKGSSFSNLPQPQRGVGTNPPDALTATSNQHAPDFVSSNDADRIVAKRQNAMVIVRAATVLRLTAHRTQHRRADQRPLRSG